MKQVAFLRSFLKFNRVYRSMIIAEVDLNPESVAEIMPLLEDIDKCIARSILILEHLYVVTEPTV